MPTIVGDNRGPALFGRAERVETAAEDILYLCEKERFPRRGSAFVWPQVSIFDNDVGASTQAFLYRRDGLPPAAGL